MPYSVIHSLLSRQYGSSKKTNGHPNNLNLYLSSPYSTSTIIQSQSSFADNSMPSFAAQFANTRQFGHLLAVTDEEGFITILDSSKMDISSSNPTSHHTVHQHPTVLTHFMAHKNAIFDVAWGNNDHYLMTASGDQTVRIWDLERNVCRGRLVGHTGTVKSIKEANNNPNLLVTASRDGSARLWDLRTIDGSNTEWTSAEWEHRNGIIHSGGRKTDKSILHLADCHKPRYVTKVTSRKSSPPMMSQYQRLLGSQSIASLSTPIQSSVPLSQEAAALAAAAASAFRTPNNSQSDSTTGSSSLTSFTSLNSSTSSTSSTSSISSTSSSSSSSTSSMSSTLSSRRRRSRPTVRRIPASIVSLPPRKVNTSRMHNASVTYCLFDGTDSTLYTSGAVDGMIKGWDIRAMSTSRKRKHHDCKFVLSPTSWMNNNNDGYNGGDDCMLHGRCPSPDMMSHNNNSSSSSSSSSSSNNSNSNSNSNTESFPSSSFSSRSYSNEEKRQHGISWMSLDSTKSRLLVSYLGVGMYEYNVHGATPYKHRPRHYDGHWQSSFYVRSGWGPNDDTVISGSTSGSVFIWDASKRGKSQRKRPKELVGHTQESTAVTWNKHNPSMLGSCSDDDTLRIWTMNRNEKMRTRDECSYQDTRNNIENDGNEYEEWTSTSNSTTCSGASRKRRSSVEETQTKKRQREDGVPDNVGSSWSTSSSQPGVQSSIFRYLTPSQPEEDIP